MTRKLPNVLTLSRLLLLLLLVLVLLLRGGAEGWPAAAALGLFALMIATDALDGFLARRLGATSTVGLYLDPLVDKVVATVLLVLFAIERPEWFPAGMVLLIVGRDIAVQGFRSIAPCKGVVLRTGLVSRLKAGFQFLSITAGLAGAAGGGMVPGEAVRWTVGVLLAGALVTGYASMVHLLWQHGHLLEAPDVELSVR